MMATLPPVFPIAPSPPPLSVPEQLVKLLGDKTRVSPQGLMIFNEPLVQAIVQQGPAAIEPLRKLLRHPHRDTALVEALYTAQRMAEARVPGVAHLYGAASQHNGHPNPLVQIYLSGFYRQLDRPESFGPLLSTLMHQAVYHYPQRHLWQDPSEELGGTVLQLIANRSADETLRRLQPVLAQLEEKIDDLGNS